jgi:dTDP-4-dehydrorhamnose reductase
MNKILVTGANGLLGQYLVPLLIDAGYCVIAVGKGANRLPYTDAANFSWRSIDITDDFLMNQLLEEEKPATIVHAAAITQVDDCQLNQENCEAVNVRATAQLLLSAEAFSQHFIYISTDFVFDGERGDYKETDDLSPLSWYGFTKLQAESIVEAGDMPFAIIRTCLVYGNVRAGARSNIINWVRKSLEANQPLKIVTDQWRTPTYAADLSKGILLVIQKKATGIFHISGKNKLTPYDMAVQAARIYKLDAALIEPTDGRYFSQPARRPPKTGVDISKARNELGYEPHSFEEALQAMVEGE